MITALKALASLLARDPLTVDEVIEQLGKVTKNYTWNVLLTPHNPVFKEVSVGRAVDSATRKPANIPSYVEVTPTEPPAIEILAQAFGTYKRIPAEKKVPPQAIFYLDISGQPYTIALIADIKDNHATRIALRRDKR